MADKSAIEWTDATWNPVTGCSKVSPGCLGAHCYAETTTARYAGQPGWIEQHRPWTPENAEHNVRIRPERLSQPLGWKKPRMIFTCSMSDLFHELVPYEFIRETFDVMRRCGGSIVAATGRSNPGHIFQVLTKRPEHALALWRERKLGFETWPPNIWLGVSIENARYTWRADVLRQIPAAVRFISAEPLLGSLFPPESEPIYATCHTDGEREVAEALLLSPAARAKIEATLQRKKPLDLTGIDWLIVGGESGGRMARPMHPQWARELRDACLLVDEPAIRQRLPAAFFFKQWGSWGLGSRKGRPSLFVASDGFTTEDPWTDPRLAEDRRRDGHTERWRSLTWMGYAGSSPKSGGKLLDGREWCEMPGQLVEAAA